MILGGKPIIRGTRIRANIKPIEENVSLKILVTGASDYIGGQVAQRLFKDGNDVVCMTHGNKAVGSIPTVQGDLLDPKSLLNACRGVDVIRVKLGCAKWTLPVARVSVTDIEFLHSHVVFTAI